MVEIINDATLSLFESMCEGFGKPIYDNQIGENFFKAFLSEDNMIYIYYTEGRREIRKVSGVPALLPTYNEEEAERKSPVSLYMIDLDNRRINCGMSCVLRLADDSVFIFDGGYFTFGERERLYDLLRSFMPEGKLKIRGWFFSHAHQDHFGCFIEFVNKYKDEMELEGLYYTFPSLDLPEAVKWKQSDNSTMREFYYTLDLYLKDVPKYLLHTGEKFSFEGVKFEVMFTHEDIYPETIGSFNDTSSVLMMTVDGYKTLWLGDLHTKSCRKMEAMYKELLKADVVQVAHHGFNGSTIETYEYAHPSVALWPTAKYAYLSNTERDVNAHLIAMKCVKEHLIAGYEETIRLDLPYKIGSKVKIDLPKREMNNNL